MSQLHRASHPGQQPAPLHRPAAADGVRRAVDRPADAEEQRRRARQGRQGVRRADHDHHGGDRELLRPHLSGAAGGLSGAQHPRAHVDELLGRPERARRARRQRRKKIVVVGTLDRGLQPDVRARAPCREGGYEIYMVADASGGTSVDAHKYAMDRMVQAGVVPVTWQQVLLEWQRDWARKETYNATIATRRRSIRARTAWAWTTPTRWSTRRRSASSTASGSARIRRRKPDLTKQEAAAGTTGRRFRTSRVQSDQNSPTMRPSGPMSIELAAGTRGRPGIVMTSPQIATTNSAPADSRTSRRLMV